MFTNEKREGTDKFVRAISLYVAETPSASIKDQEHQLPIIPFGIVAYGFVGQRFSKQLYITQSKEMFFSHEGCTLDLHVTIRVV